MKIYTKTGDEGTTGLLGGDRAAKHSLRITAIGEVDELNGAIGMARATELPLELGIELGQIQSRLFDLGAELAAPTGSKFDRPSIFAEDVTLLEEAMDRMTETLPPLRAFILPGGTPGAAALHFARSVCRRSERAVLHLHENEAIRAEARIFLNRLSDYLFVAARVTNASLGVQDVEWRSREEKKL